MGFLARQLASRQEAAARLAPKLAPYRSTDTLVMGIPRGGIVIADVIARALDCDLDVVLTRKIGAPGNPELAVGAVAENGQVFINEAVAGPVGADEAYIEREKARQLEEIRVRRERYRSVLAPSAPSGRPVVVVDDGVATGATMLAALWAVGSEKPSRTVAAVPIGAPQAIARLRQAADEVVCLLAPQSLRSIGQHYEDFPQVDDSEVLAILQTHQRRRTALTRGQDAGEHDPNHRG